MVNRPCLDCGKIAVNKSRCPSCERIYVAAWMQRKEARRQHYKDPAYRSHARKLKIEWNANPFTTCHICGEAAIANDPWSVDHLVPGDNNAPLLPAHFSCNSRRINQNKKQ